MLSKITVVKYCGVCSVNSSFDSKLNIPSCFNSAKRKPVSKSEIKMINNNNNIARRKLQKPPSLPSYSCIFVNLKALDQTDMGGAFFIGKRIITTIILCPLTGKACTQKD